MTPWSPKQIVCAFVLLALGLVPVIAGWLDEPFYTVLFSRM